MKILRNYILKECVIPFILALTVLTCVFLLGNLIQLTNLVINKGVKITVIGHVFFLSIPVLIGYTLPVACLISVILAFSRMTADNEIIAMRTCGINMRKILAPLAVIGLILSLICIILNEKIIPYAHHRQRMTLKNLGLSNPAALLESERFIHAFNDQIIFIRQIDGNRMQNITIYQPQPDGKPTRTIIAKAGEFTPVPGTDQIRLKLMNGTADEPDIQNHQNFYKLNFSNYFMTLDLSKDKVKVEKKPKSMTFKELTEEINRLERLLVDTSRLRTEYHRKITWSFSVLIFILLGFPLAVITHRREKMANVIIAILCGASYYLLSLGCEALGIQRVLPAALAMWIPNLLGLGAAGWLNYRLCAS